jgi:hypothetical protein
VLTLCSHCNHTVLALFPYCTRTVTTLYSHCTRTVITLYLHCTRTVTTLYLHCSHTVLHSYRTVLTLYSAPYAESLQFLQMQIDIVSTAEEMVARFEHGGWDYSFCVVDEHLSEAGGVMLGSEGVAELKKRGCMSKFICCSGNCSPADHERYVDTADCTTTLDCIHSTLYPLYTAPALHYTYATGTSATGQAWCGPNPILPALTWRRAFAYSW